ncbi:MAG: hypothetical protein ACNA7W_07935 [Pseudomonadales bacterium]
MNNNTTRLILRPWGQLGLATLLLIVWSAGGWADAGQEAAEEAARSQHAAGRLAATEHAVAPGIVLTSELYPGALDLMEPSETLIIDMRTAPEGTAEEAAAAALRGIAYHNQPISSAAISIADLDAVAAVLADAGTRTVVWHCATGNRAGLFWGALELRRGAPLAAVLENLEGVVTSEAVRDALGEFAAGLELMGGHAD